MLCHVNLHLNGALEVLDELWSDIRNVVHLLVLKHRTKRRLLHRLCKDIHKNNIMINEGISDLKTIVDAYNAMILASQQQHIHYSVPTLVVDTEKDKRTGGEGFAEEVIRDIRHLAEHRQVRSTLDLQTVCPGLA